MAGQNLENIKRRLSTVTSTKKITNAMKLVSSVKVTKLTSFYGARKKYFNNISKIYDNSIFYSINNPEATYNNPYLVSNNLSNKTLYIVVTSSLGLCANHNHNIIKEFKNSYKNGDEVFAIGTKGYEELHNDDIRINTDFIDVINDLSFANINALKNKLCDIYVQNEYKEIRIIYSDYVNTLISKPKNEVLLPLEIKTQNNRGYSPVYEPKKDKFINDLVDEFLIAKLFYYLADSKLSEENARRNAMDNATKNANDLIDKLYLEYNKARQSAITQEITEVIAGSKK